jgi:hypothetical protein
MARKNCPKETIEVEIKCGHCRDALGMVVWKYEVRVRRGGVCEGCWGRCWGFVGEGEGGAEGEGVGKEVTKGTKEEEEKKKKGKVGDDGRRDSFLMQGEEERIGVVRKVKSERNLIGSVSADVHMENELRKVRSDQQLQPRPPTTSIDAIAFSKTNILNT